METVAHILVVDDEPDLRDVLRILLEANHYRVTEAANAEQALARVQSDRTIQLVLLDVCCRTCPVWKSAGESAR